VGQKNVRLCEVIYKKGNDDVVAKYLSQNYNEEESIFSLSFLVPDGCRKYVKNG
jgi:hypothetical protein